MKKNILSILCIFNFFGTLFSSQDFIKMYFCTGANSKYFNHSVNLIGSIHTVNFNETVEIAVFDLGLKTEERAFLNSIMNVKVYDVEKTNPYMFDPIPTHPYRTAPGSYSWKPVITKQALEMFPYVLFLDAGTTVLNPLNDLFKYIVQKGYFFTDCELGTIKKITTQYVIEKLNLKSDNNKWILDDSTLGMASGIMGLSRSLYKCFALPMYEFTKDIRLFIDDGSSQGGFGWGRHDQSLYSIMTQLNHFDIHIQDNGDGRLIYLPTDNQIKPIHITWMDKQVNEKTVLFSSRSYMPQFEKFKQAIHFQP